ncbi:hypothetical protein FO519_004023 [Halicephalobus sp. NKZ332]|nr:hypothetical protein FO519_004023 [Halicephalobus sp. NKZ332]
MTLGVVSHILPPLAVNHNVSDCFGKIRTVASVDNLFRSRLDSAARSSRLDSIVKVLMGKADQVCTQEERDFVVDYLDKHQDAIMVTETIVKNLTNEEKDHLNIWNNLNDTASEANLFLRKFQALPLRTQIMLRKSLNDILNTFIGSSLSPALSKVITHFNKSDVEQLQIYAKEHQFSALSYFIASRISKTDLSPSDMNGVYKFLYQIFSY